MIRLSFPDIDKEEIEAVSEVLKSGYLVQGDMVELLEKNIKDFFNVKYAFCVSSGTAALHLACLALNIEENDEIIVPAFTFPATANVVEIVKASNKFIDIDLKSYCLDIDRIEKLISNRTKAIIPVHEFGYPVNMEKIIDIANKYNLKIIEDAACAFGSKFNDKYVGTFGDIGCFSLHPRKAITTGEGGVVITNNEKIALKIKALRNHGIIYENEKPKFYYAGLNYRLTNFQGALGVIQLQKFPKIIEKRKNLVKLYNSLLNDINEIKLPEEPQNGFHSWQTYHILIEDKIDRDDLIKFLKLNGIETNYGANALHIEPYYINKYNYKENDYPNSLKAYKQGLALPLHTFLKDEDLIYIFIKLKEYFGKNR